MSKKESVDAASMHPIVHTPGPWKYHDAGSIVMTEDGQMSVADIRGFGRLEKDFGLSAALKIMDKNGQLIAAAPELLEACQLFVSAESHSEMNVAFNAAKAAIEKAAC
jgi:hypothetical protein